MSRPTERLGPFDLERFEAAAREAVDRRDLGRFDVVGQGEFSLAVRWEPERVVKRVPPFRDRASADRYRALLADYVAALEGSGMACVATEAFVLDRADGSAVVHLSQPYLDPSHLGPAVLAGHDPDPEHPFLTSMIDAVVAAVGPSVGVDAQVDNWYWHEGRPWHLDFSTPLLMGDDALPRFDLDGFFLEYPLIVRPLVRRELRRLAPKVVDLPWVLQDVAANLHRQSLEHWVPAFGRAVRARSGIELDVEAARKAYEADARLYPMLQRLRRWQRRWLQLTGRRSDAMLPVAANY